MAGRSEQIDAISVGVGLNLGRVRQDMARVQQEIRAQSGQGRVIKLPTTLDTSQRVIQDQIRNFGKVLGREMRASGNIIHAPVQLIADPNVMRNFRRTLEANLKGQDQQGIKVAIQVANIQQFRAQIEEEFKGKPIQVEVVAKRGGGGGGAGPAGPAAPARAPRTPPSGGGGGAASAGGGPGPAPARPAQRTARARAQQTYVAPVTAALQYTGDLGPEPVERLTPRQERQAAGRARGPRNLRQAPAAPPSRNRADVTFESTQNTPRTIIPQAGTERMDLGGSTRAPSTSKRRVRPVQSPRMSVDELRANRPEEELQGEDRAAYASQMRARGARMGTDAGDTAAPHRTQTGFRATAAGGEALAQQAHRAAAAARMARPVSQEAVGHFATGLHSLHPALGELMDIMRDPENPPTIESLDRAMSAVSTARGVYGGASARNPKVRRQARRISGIKNYNMERDDPVQLQFDAALKAAGTLRRQLLNPLESVQKGDQSRRGRGGKVGQRGGFTAGQLASESVDPEGVEEIVANGGTRGLTGKYDKATVSRARAILAERRAKPEGAPGNPEEGGAAYYAAGEAPSIPGGQGMTRGGPDLAAESASREHLKRVRKNQAATGIGDAPPVAPPRPEPFVPGQAHYGRGASRRPSFPGFSTDQDFGNAGRPRASRPKQNMGGGPTPRAQQAYEEFQTGQAGARDAFGGAFNGAFRGQYRSAYQRFGEQPGEEPIVEGQSNRRVRALLAMAKATESPEEAQTAQEMLKRMGITHFDVGGVLPPWTTIKREMKVQGAAPRPGSKLRKAIEQRYLSRVQNREKRAKKPKYMQGGKSDPKYAAVRAAQIKKQPWCASCGSTENLTADHIHDTASGGDIYDPSNFQTLCLSCNSRKSGGSKARPILTPYAKFAPGADPWGSDRTSFEDEMGFNRRAMGGPMKKGKWKWGKYAEGGDTGGTYRSGGLLERMAQAGHQPSITMVGERGPELIVTDEKGDSEVVPTHKVPTWLQRAQEGRGVAKDMTGRAGGGPIRFRQNGAYAAQGSVAGAAVQAGLASSLSGGVQRVFVTNWPSGTAVAGYGSVGQRPAQAKAAAPVGAPAGAQQQSPGAFQPGAHAPQPGSVPKGRIKINPLTRVESRRLGYTSTEDIEERLQRVGAGIQESLQEAPVRALSVAFGQIAQTAIGGRGGILARAAGARRLAGGARREQGELTRLETQRRELALQTRQLRAGPQNQQTTDQITSNIGELKQLGPAIIRQRQITEARTSRAEQAQGSILSRGQQFRAQAVGLGGIIAGTQLFTTAVAALSGAEQAASAALKPLVDQFLGWPAAIDKVTASVRDSIQAANGNVRGGVAGALAPSGISAAFLDQQGGNVTQIATSRAAQLAAQQGLDVTRAAAASGGSSRGLFEGTGGLLGSNIATDVFGGQEGFLQTVAKRLQVNRPSELQKAVGSLGNPLGGALNTGPADRGFLGLFPNDRAQFEDAQKRLATENRNTGSFYEDNQAKADEDIVRRFQSSQGSPDRQQGVIKDLNRNLSDAAKYAGDAAGAFKLVTGATQEQTDAMIKSAQATNDQGAVDRAKDFAASGVTVLGPGGRALQGAEFQKYAEQQARGTLIQDPALLLRQTQQQRQAQVDQMRAQLQFTQREDIPAQFALENAAKPQQHFGTTFTTQGLAGTQGGDQTLQNIQKYTQLAGAAQQDIQKSITEGQQSLNAIVSRAGPEALQDFTKTVDSISSLGSTITGLQEGISFRQVNLETHEYNEQLRLADRSLGDAKDFMSAIHGAVIGTVGGLQGQNALLDRQNQLLGRRQQQLSFKSEDIGFKSNDLQYQLQQMQFAQTQRQINFSKASAGFTAPGDTPEERAARIEQAKIEAREAQKQLNIQRQIAAMAREQLQIARQSAQINRQVFANQNKQQDNAFKQTIQEASRSVGDLEKQIGLLTESHAINIDSRAVDETVAKLEKQQGRLINKAQAYLQAGQDIRSNIIAGVADIQAATGKGWSELVGQVNKAWQSLFSGYATEYKNLLGTINGGSGTPGARGSGPAGNKLQAEGGIHVVNRATRFVAGEAGSEAVLVIRNPQQGMMSMPSYTAAGGGGATINIMVSGNTVRSDKDIDTLVYRIKREMSRDLALSGGRRNF